jgi:tRNA-intron endonuclease
MKEIIGELLDNRITIKKSKDVGRLYNKSRFGETISGNKLVLNLIEGVFLVDEGKLKVYQKGNEIFLRDLIKISHILIPNFEIIYLVFKDLRKRGYPLKIFKEKNEFNFYLNKKDGLFNDNKNLCYIKVFSERSIMNINKINQITKKAYKNNIALWFTIVDEEGDITYYNISISNIKGEISEGRYEKITGKIFENRIVIFDKKNSNSLFEEEFYGKPFGKGLQLSMVEALYLMKKKILKVTNIDDNKFLLFNQFKKLIIEIQPDINLRFAVFTDLKKRGLIVKTGFKFGSHFRAYRKDPFTTHAEYLINVVDKDFISNWAETSRAVRLAHSVNKEIIFGIVTKNNIEYLKFGRLRP